MGKINGRIIGGGDALWNLIEIFALFPYALID